MESAREAVANGSAGETEIMMAAKGVEVNHKGEIVLASGHGEGQGAMVNGLKSQRPSNGKRQREDEEHTTPPRDRMDISLHNDGDYAHEAHG